MGILVDSSVLIAFFNEADHFHTEAKELLFKQTQQLVVHEYVVLETATVLMMRSGKANADSFLRIMLGNAAFTILHSKEESFLRTIEEFLGQKSKLSFVDLALLAHAEEYTLLTLDVTLQKAIKSKR
ncbi:MAG: hypothetical protein AB202_02905 [Parcubacteria bacterium C7867-007]|nr:MAG: hypothetical protein AB202_02905 [Parcubacteria bacterium C7867-007]